MRIWHVYIILSLCRQQYVREYTAQINGYTICWHTANVLVLLHKGLPALEKFVAHSPIL